MSRLYDLCAASLAGVVSHYANEGVPLPARQYVANGDRQIALDCEQLTVAHQISNSHSGNVAVPVVVAGVRDPGAVMRSAQIAVTLARCAPTPTQNGLGGRITVPSVEDETDSAEVIYRDTELILDAIVAAQRAGLLASCGSVALLQTETPGTSGGLAMVKLTFRLGLE